MSAILPSSVSSILSPAIIAAEFMLTLSEKETALFHPVFSYQTGLPGSTVVRVPVLGFGESLMSDRTPGVEVTATSISNTAIDITLAPKSLRHSLDDFAGMLTGSTFSNENVALSLARSYANTMFSLVASLSSSFSESVGTTGVSLSWDSLVDAKTALASAGATGPMLALIHPDQWGQLEKALLGSGVAKEDGVFAGALLSGLSQYKGRFLGIDFFVTSFIPTANAGADHAGCLLSTGAVCIADTEYRPAFMAGETYPAGHALLEITRGGSYGVSDMLIHAAMGTAIGINAAGCQLISKVA
jgi:hypothetical protein